MESPPPTKEKAPFLVTDATAFATSFVPFEKFRHSMLLRAAKVGFFGFDDSTGKFTFIPDATIINNLVGGTKGFLDIKGIYFQTGDFDSTGNGIVYFDSTGKQVGAAGTAAGITTSNFILTTDANNIPKWTTTIDGGSF